MFRQVGSIGVFDLQTTLINLVVATGLLSVATVMVDLLMQYALPQRDRYTRAKFDEVNVSVGMETENSAAEDADITRRPSVPNPTVSHSDKDGQGLQKSLL